MEVIFDAKEIMGVTVHQQLKLQYEKQIAALASKILEVKYLSLVDKIVIPENFIQSVLDFQKAQNMGEPSVKNNELDAHMGKCSTIP